MKKMDFVVIMIIVLISISSYLIYFKSIDMSDENYIEIAYKNNVLMNVKLEDDTEMIVEIYSNNNQLTVKANDKITEYNILTDKNIYNVVSITNVETKMIDANCEDKSVHTGMKITKAMPAPIVCFNGIIVRMIGSNDDYVIIV